MTLQNVTVIIPAHNRPERLRRLLDYYSRTGSCSRLIRPSVCRCGEVPGHHLSAPP